MDPLEVPFRRLGTTVRQGVVGSSGGDHRLSDEGFCHTLAGAAFELVLLTSAQEPEPMEELGANMAEGAASPEERGVHMARGVAEVESSNTIKSFDIIAKGKVLTDEAVARAAEPATGDHVDPSNINIINANEEVADLLCYGYEDLYIERPFLLLDGLPCGVDR
ncbi:hypothetical protein ACLOJK_029862 [Asimina triloba]